MAASIVDIGVLGDKALERKLARLPGTVQKKVVRQAMRKSAKRVHAKLLSKVNGFPVGVVTGQYKAAVAKAKPRAGKRSRSLIQMVIPRPAEAEDAITQGALEYGRSNMAARPHVRPAVDEDIAANRAQIARDIAAGIVREAKRK